MGLRWQTRPGAGWRSLCSSAIMSVASVNGGELSDDEAAAAAEDHTGNDAGGGKGALRTQVLVKLSRPKSTESRRFLGPPKTVSAQPCDDDPKGQRWVFRIPIVTDSLARYTRHGGSPPPTSRRLPLRNHPRGGGRVGDRTASPRQVNDQATPVAARLHYPGSGTRRGGVTARPPPPSAP